MYHNINVAVWSVLSSRSGGLIVSVEDTVDSNLVIKVSWDSYGAGSLLSEIVEFHFWSNGHADIPVTDFRLTVDSGGFESISALFRSWVPSGIDSKCMTSEFVHPSKLLKVHCVSIAHTHFHCGTEISFTIHIVESGGVAIQSEHVAAFCASEVDS